MEAPESTLIVKKSSAKNSGATEVKKPATDKAGRVMISPRSRKVIALADVWLQGQYRSAGDEFEVIGDEAIAVRDRLLPDGSLEVVAETGVFTLVSDKPAQWATPLVADPAPAANP